MTCYIYKAQLYCIKCGDGFVDNLLALGKRNQSKDSNLFPQHTNLSERDFVETCDCCGTFLKIDLSDNGRKNLMDDILWHIHEKSIPNSLIEWINFYDISLEDILRRIQVKKSDVKPSNES